jgi:tetratricopeptide (TPR) repeat protein
MIQRFLFLALSVVVTSCAVPRSHKDFSLSRPGLGDNQEEFVSSTDLRVAGLVSEGLSFANNGRMFNAEGRMRQAAFLEPSNDRIAFNLAVILNQSEQSAEALAILERLLAKEPQNPNYLQAAADVLVSEGRHEEAKSKLKEAFAILKAAKNSARAAVVARSISNIAFGVGSEQEALCYSYEAVTLSPLPPQVSAHIRLLVALNLFSEAKSAFDSQKQAAQEPLAFHSVAMATYAQGDFKRALELEESALGRLSKAPELTQEINAAWWVMKQKFPDSPADAQDSEEKMKELEEAAKMFMERAPYALVMWPPAVRRELVKLTAGVK